jgi:hypothetical protein
VQSAPKCRHTAPDREVAHLLECFGWKDGRPDGVEIPRLFVIADAGRRVEREVARA